MEFSERPAKFCDLGYFIYRYFNVLIDVFRTDLNTGNTYTKCLYTAITMMFLLCGEKAKEDTEFCRVSNVKERLDNHPQKTKIIERISFKLMQDVLKPSQRRMVYYVMITNTMMTKNKNYKGAGKEMPKMFPGHVFVIEKLVHPRTKENLYMIYQSYINEYTLIEFTREKKQSKNTPKMQYSYAEMETFLKRLHTFINSPTWDKEQMNFWKQFTLVDVSEFKGYQIHPQILFCYRKRSAKQCKADIVKMLEEKKRNGQIPTHREDDVDNILRDYHVRNKCSGSNHTCV